MGHDAMAVVDDQLRVHGVTGLRVADASIMPALVSGNTNAPTIAIASKLSEMLCFLVVWFFVPSVPARCFLLSRARPAPALSLRRSPP